MSIALRRLKGSSKDLVNKGAFWLGATTGIFAYFNYRLHVTKTFLMSEGMYRFTNFPVINMTPFEAVWLTWYRMPDQEYDVYHRFRPYFILGQIDYTKEVLIPKRRVINGEKVDGFDVLNPIYCYDGARLNLEAVPKEMINKIITPERAALILHRGWIPYVMKDKKNRPWEVNSRKLVRVEGVFRRSKDVHDYKYPNDPASGEWHNLCTEDIARYWDLSNSGEMKFFYFQQVDVKDVGGSVDNDGIVRQIPHVLGKEETIRDYYSWWIHEKYHKYSFMTMGPISAASLALFYLSL